MIEMNKTFVTVCTPTYNRGNLLYRPFYSLMNQSNKQFIWLIIDDGSFDNTKTIINKFEKEADFPIEYFYKKNGGRHTALNLSYQKIHTEFVINLDSDDELCPDAIERIYNIIVNNNICENDKIWQISGRCLNSQTKKMIGKPFPVDINCFSGRAQRRKRNHSFGEKSNCRKLSILKKYPFPVYSDTKFVSENTIWEKIDLIFDSYCTNEAFCIYYEDSFDSLAKGKMHNETKYKTQFYYGIFAINNLTRELPYNKSALYSVFNVPRTALLSKINYRKVMKYIDKYFMKVIVTIFGYPIAFLYIISFEKNDRIKKIILKIINK